MRARVAASSRSILVDASSPRWISSRLSALGACSAAAWRAARRLAISAVLFSLSAASLSQIARSSASRANFCSTLSRARAWSSASRLARLAASSLSATRRRRLSISSRNGAVASMAEGWHRLHRPCKGRARHLGCTVGREGAVGLHSGGDGRSPGPPRRSAGNSQPYGQLACTARERQRGSVTEITGTASTPPRQSPSAGR
jgi:hypothetical protein